MGPLLQKVPVKKLQNPSNCDTGDMTGKTERNFNCSTDTVMILRFREGAVQPRSTLFVIPSASLVWTYYFMVKLYCSNFRVIAAFLSVDRIFRTLPLSR